MRPTVMSVGYIAIIKPIAFLLILRIQAGKIVAGSVMCLILYKC